MRKKAHVVDFEMLSTNLAGRTDPRIRQESESDDRESEVPDTLANF